VQFKPESRSSLGIFSGNVDSTHSALCGLRRRNGISGGVSGVEMKWQRSAEATAMTQRDGAGVDDSDFG
jgi:hypothetical protein